MHLLCGHRMGLRESPAAALGRSVRVRLRRNRNALPGLQRERQRTGAHICRMASELIWIKRAGIIGDRGCKRLFYDPIPLLKGDQLVTLQDAGTNITKLPKAKHATAEWQAAMEADPACRAWRTDDVCTHWRHARSKSACRARVQSRSQRHTLGSWRGIDEAQSRIDNK